ncbi:MAG: hypothetical protein IJX39_04875 [Clostridia bacterium]|nr:hypothetical protein [Clostridia bacterium]
MTTQKILSALSRRILCLVKSINKRLGEPFFYLTSECGFFRLYALVDDRDKLIMSGRCDIEGLSRLYHRLDEASISI